MLRRQRKNPAGASVHLDPLCEVLVALRVLAMPLGCGCSAGAFLAFLAECCASSRRAVLCEVGMSVCVSRAQCAVCQGIT